MTTITGDKTILYDDQCPLCRAYTGAFVKSGLLEKRIPFSQVQSQQLQQIDALRACNEIPLLDDAGGATLYGMDGLLFLLGRRFPLVHRVFRLKFVNWFFRRLYKFISYNRKVIAPAHPVPGFDCSPAFNTRYRWYYIVTAMLLATLCSYLFVVHASIYTSNTQLFISLGIAGSKWIVLSALAVIIHKKKQALVLLGHLATVCFIGSALLLPGFFFTNNYAFFILLVLSVLVMTKEFYRRAVLLGIAAAWWLWVLILIAAISGQYALLA